jgi:hypothetical protein
MRRPSASVRRRATAIAVALAVAAVVVPRPAIADGPFDDDQVDLVSEGVVDATSPSISADGRWVVFGGTVGERRSVFRTDRDTGETTELSLVPEGVRSGDTVGANLSADGCVIAAITEIPFDLFRDDDRDQRWDVYRLLLPECGGRPNAWELVSASERSGTARDDVFANSAPAISGSGAVIAFAHPLPGAPDGVATISVVDVTVPINEPGRVTPVAGMPVESPNRAYLYRGATQPALSQNGRHLAFVSDATSSDLLPGWAEGPVLGAYATAQVYVWDRVAPDPRRAVRLVSGRDGRRSDAGGAAPAMSEDGRIVVFTSRDRRLVTAELSGCEPECPNQVYRFDRDTDGNGIFDEPPRRSPISIVSAIDAGVIEVGAPRAGNASSWAPAVNADGSQIAFITDSTNLLPSRRGGGGLADHGDLLVAEYGLGQLRRVVDHPHLTAVPGAHGRPALSKTGQVIAFETMAAGPLMGMRRAGVGRSVFTVAVTPKLSLAALDFGTVLLGLQSAELYAKVLNAGPAAFEPRDLRISANFAVTGGTCVPGVIVAAGTSCSVKLTFTPTEPRGYSGTLTVSGRTPAAGLVSTTIRGAAGEPTLLAEPGGVDVDAGIVGDIGGRVAIDIKNVGFLPTSIARLAVGGAHPEDFHIVTQSCTGRAINPDASCTVEVEFHPLGAGYRSALLIATTPIGQYTSAVLGGFARYDPELVTELPSARPGGQLGIGGNRFPANSMVSIGFDDGGEPFTTATTNDVGKFLAIVTLPARLRSGERRLVASSVDGAVATVTITVEGSVRPWDPTLPGSGVG